MGTLTLAEFVDGPWKLACYNRCKSSTRKRVDSALNRQVLPVFGDKLLNSISPILVHDWFTRYSSVAPGGANRTLDVLRQIFNHAIECGSADRNPTAGVRRNPGSRLTRFLSVEEVHRMHAALDAHRGRGSGSQQADVIRLLLYTGCRKGEVIGLRWAEVDVDRLHLHDSKVGPRTVLLNQPAREVIARQTRSGSAFVFPSRFDSSKPRSDELSLWRKVRRTAELKDVRLHDLRHTFASHAALANVPLPVIARLLGHSRERMTLRYAHISDHEAQDAAERIGNELSTVLGLA